jgi:hypothetical protein
MPIPYFYAMNLFNRCLLLLVIAAALTTGCDSPDSKSSRRHPRADALAKDEFLRPDVFLSAPGKVEGCVGLYTYDSLNIPFDALDVDKGRKIFVTKAKDFAFFRLHNKDIVLHYDRSQSGQLDSKTIKEVYKGEEYTAVLITHSIETQGETVWSGGTLEIIRGDRHLIMKVRGLSGC